MAELLPSVELVMRDDKEFLWFCGMSHETQKRIIKDLALNKPIRDARVQGNMDRMRKIAKDVYTESEKFKRLIHG